MVLNTPLAIQVFWFIGFAVSIVAFIFQILIYFLIPFSRKLSQKLLTQLTIARLLNVALEYVVTSVVLDSSALNDAINALYVQTDAALICWMFVFTKNLFDDIVIVFVKKTSLTIVTVIIWIVTFPIGLLCPLMLELDSRNENIEQFSYFNIFYKVYAIVKFVILIINLVLYGFIFRVALSRGNVLRTCVVSFCLVSVSSAQVLLTDLLTYSLDEYPMVSFTFAVINSYQVLAITAIFVILVQNLSEESLTKKIVKKFVKETI